MKKYNHLIQKGVDEKRLYTLVKEISSYHRIQASTGFREAAKYCYNTLIKLGIEAKILTYKADPDVWFLQNKSFMEWDLKEAWIRLEEEDLLLADAQAEPISIIQKSYPYDFTNGCEIVYLEEGNHKEKYEDIDLKGKIIFVRDAFNGYMDWAIKEKGAIGVITDYIRPIEGVRDRNALYETLNYTSFWWTHDEDEVKCFGFVLSPKMGDTLAKLCKKQKALYDENKTESPNLTCYGKVETSLYVGEMEVVEAILPGESAEEVLLTAHLCHPKCSCNDNASGVASAIESLRVLKTLMDAGKLEKNKRTIKILLIPEFTGTYAYLSDHTNYQKCVGAINMDMVGGKQTRFYGPITLTSLPYSTPSFVNDLTALCMDYASEEGAGLNGNKIAKTNHIVESYAGGSDHVVFSDPTIGVPCCMIGQWPDLNYHTSSDTLDVIDPQVLKFSTNIATLFLYTLANLSVSNFKEIQIKAHTSLANKLADVAKQLYNQTIDLKKAQAMLNHIEHFYNESVSSYHKVLDMDPHLLEKEWEYNSESVNHMREYLGILDYPQNYTNTDVYVRNYVGPIDKLKNNVALQPKCKPLLEAYEKAYKKGKRAYDVETLLQFYIDGKNNVSQIIEKVECDLGVDCKEMAEALFELLKALKMISVK